MITDGVQVPGTPMRLAADQTAVWGVLVGGARQRWDSWAVTVPLVLRVHFWFAPPVQSQMPTADPGAVAWLRASRHLPPNTRSSLAAVLAHCWLVPPWQSQMIARVPFVWLAPL